jgi:urea transport system substrate-binding protein
MASEPSRSETDKDLLPSDKSPSDETQRMAAMGGDTVESPGAAARQWIGKRLGKHHVTELIGAGGMGFVLKAHDPTLERDVAIKMLHLATNPTALSRFRTEAKAAGKLSHANVAAIYEIGQEGPVHYQVMELLTGGSVVEDLLQQGAYTPLEATRVMIDACRGIAAAHTAGLIHRDIKPANLVRAADRSVKVTDFGLAKLASADAAGAQLTQAGTVIGTPYFMSPEQWQGQTVDARSDIYALGATYYCLLTGRQPFEDSAGVIQIMRAHCGESVPDPRSVDPAIPPACSTIVSRAMAKDPADRYQSAMAMLSDLQAVAATLSGEVRIDLPSQSGTAHAAMAPAHRPQPTSARRRMIFGSIGLILLLAIIALTARSYWERSPSGPQVSSAPQGEPIKVGVLQSLSGTMSASGTSVIDATLLAIEDINEAGGLLGRPVKAIVADGRSDAQTFAREAERLITQEQVCTVFGCWTSASRKTVRPIFEHHDHPLVYPVKYEGMETSPNIIYLGAAPNQQIIPAVLWARESLGKRQFFLVGSDYVFPRAAAEVIKDQLQKLDASVSGEAFVPLANSEFDSIVQAIVDAKPDLILNMLAGDSNTVFFRALRKAGVEPSDIPCMSFSVGEQELRGLDIADVEGDYAALTYFQSLDTPHNKAFVQRFTEKYPQRVVSDPMENAYVGVQLWAQAVREAQSIEPKKIRRAMLNQRLAAPKSDVRIDPETQHCFKTPRVGQIRNDGQFHIVWSAAEPIRPEPYPASRTAEDWKALLHDLYTGWGNQWTSPPTD